MSTRTALVACCGIAATLAVAGVGACRGRQDAAGAALEQSARDSAEARAAAAAHEVMSGPMAEDLHLKLTPLRPSSPADAARAAALVDSIRRSLAKYRDVAVADSDGFRQFLPRVQQPIYHFTNRRWALEEMLRFDPAKPTSLLYRQDANGRFVLVGVMYAAPARMPLDELDRRIPLSVARWHQHVNWCVPGPGELARWRQTSAGVPLFGPKSPIATADACAGVGGLFLPRVFGWMVHVMAFEGDDPAVIWGAHEHHHS